MSDETPLPPVARAVRDSSPPDRREGLRERKKRLTRQQISDTATMLFLERGFDEVRVSDVAAACGVSEKTVFNYFATKEALLLDREEGLAADIRLAFGPLGAAISPVEAALGLIDADATFSASRAAGVNGLSVIRRFGDLIEGTPSLRAAQMDMMERLAQVAAEAMAARAGVNPDDPEPQVAATALLGLWRIYFRAMRRHADGVHSPATIRNEVMEEVRRAARLVDTGLWSFGTVVQGTNSRDQMKAAANASNEARQQVMVAIKQARLAWRLLKADAHEHRRDEHRRGHRPLVGPEAEGEARRARDEAIQTMRDTRRAAQDAKRQAHQAIHEIKRVQRRQPG